MKSETFLITGANGQLGNEFQNVLSERGFPYVALGREGCDITNFTQMKKIISKVRPDVIINCAAYNLVDDAEIKSESAYIVNSEGIRNLTLLCKENNIFFVSYSTDYVFDGEKSELYTEDDIPNPINVYGKSKLKGEEIIRNSMSDFLIFRLSWVMGRGKQNYIYKFMKWVVKSNTLMASFDEMSIPTYTEDIVNVTLFSLEKGLKGLYNLTSSGYTSRYNLARYLVFKLGLDNKVVPVPMSFFNTKARRPPFSCMSNKKIAEELSISIPPWEDGIDRLLKVFE